MEPKHTLKREGNREAQIKLFHGDFRGGRLGFIKLVSLWRGGGLGGGRTASDEIETHSVMEFIVGAEGTETSLQKENHAWQGHKTVGQFGQKGKGSWWLSVKRKRGALATGEDGGWREVKRKRGCKHIGKDQLPRSVSLEASTDRHRERKQHNHDSVKVVSIEENNHQTWEEKQKAWKKNTLSKRI
jgi:hypothetical protein